MDESLYEDPARLRRRKEWEIRRAGTERRAPADPMATKDYSPIVFPDAAGMRHAALVVAGRFVGRPDAVEGTRTVLDMLAIPQIMREGGDGRTVPVQKGPVRFGEGSKEAPKFDAFSDEGEHQPLPRRPRPPRQPRRGPPVKHRQPLPWAEGDLDDQ